MINMKKYIKKFASNWKRDTPKRWKKIRNFAFAVTLVVPTAWTVTSMMPNIDFPQWIKYIVAVTVFLSISITLYSGQKTNENDLGKKAYDSIDKKAKLIDNENQNYINTDSSNSDNCSECSDKNTK